MFTSYTSRKRYLYLLYLLDFPVIGNTDIEALTVSTSKHVPVCPDFPFELNNNQISLFFLFRSDNYEILTFGSAGGTATILTYLNITHTTSQLDSKDASVLKLPVTEDLKYSLLNFLNSLPKIQSMT